MDVHTCNRVGSEGCVFPRHACSLAMNDSQRQGGYMHDHSPISPEHSMAHVIEGNEPRGNCRGTGNGLRGDGNVMGWAIPGRGGTCEADDAPSRWRKLGMGDGTGGRARSACGLRGGWGKVTLFSSPRSFSPHSRHDGREVVGLDGLKMVTVAWPAWGIGVGTGDTVWRRISPYVGEC